MRRQHVADLLARFLRQSRERAPEIVPRGDPKHMGPCSPQRPEVELQIEALLAVAKGLGVAPQVRQIAAHDAPEEGVESRPTHPPENRRHRGAHAAGSPHSLHPGVHPRCLLSHHERRIGIAVEVSKHRPKEGVVDEAGLPS